MRIRLGGPAGRADTARVVLGAYHAPRAVSSHIFDLKAH
jgi:hypothetical protein